MYISAMTMTFNIGSVSLISRSKRYKMPETVSEIPGLLPRVLKIVYNGSLAMKDTVKLIKDSTSSVSLEETEVPYFPPCFAAATTTNKKRRMDL